MALDSVSSGLALGGVRGSPQPGCVSLSQDTRKVPLLPLLSGPSQRGELDPQPSKPRESSPTERVGLDTAARRGQRCCRKAHCPRPGRAPRAHTRGESEPGGAAPGHGRRRGWSFPANPLATCLRPNTENKALADVPLPQGAAGDGRPLRTRTLCDVPSAAALPALGAPRAELSGESRTWGCPAARPSVLSPPRDFLPLQDDGCLPQGGTALALLGGAQPEHTGFRLPGRVPRLHVHIQPLCFRPRTLWPAGAFRMNGASAQTFHKQEQNMQIGIKIPCVCMCCHMCGGCACTRVWRRSLPCGNTCTGWC
ncbi:uncharacterized protein LOC123394168 [Mustela putorius furo]|uniref:Uncharacterized protein LOC123394168 n=1 Tax=Mustela putorius furo TaxID=9669 RepID=A0A8U0SJC6_MUSPF|nr:uncharacterized protein LOC123394168 [Mustela putorius furo]